MSTQTQTVRAGRRNALVYALLTFLKLSDRLCFSKVITPADISSRVRGFLQANQKTRQSQFASLEKEPGVQLTPQA